MGFRHVIALILVLWSGLVSQVPRSWAAPEEPVDANPWACLEQYAHLQGAERVAVEVAQALIQKGRLPTKAENDAFQQRHRSYRDTPAFKERLKQELVNHPRLWSAYSHPKSRGVVAAEDLAAYLIQQGELPPNRHALQKRYVQYQNDDDFMEALEKKLRGRPDLMAVFENAHLSAAHLAARDLIQFIEQHGVLPDLDSSPALYRRMHSHREDADFKFALQSSPRAQHVFAANQLSALELTARDMIAFVTRYGRVPTKHRDADLHRRYLNYRFDADFHTLLKKDPKVWAVVEPMTHAPQEGLDRTAADTIAYVLKYRDRPQQKVDRGLYLRYFRVKGDPSFIAKIRANPEAWAAFEEAGLSAAQKTAHRVVEYLRVHKTLPTLESDQAFYYQAREYWAQPEFIEIVRKDADAWAIFERQRAGLKGMTRASSATEALGDGPEDIATKVHRFFSARDLLPMLPAEPVLGRQMTALAQDLRFLRKLYEYPEVWSRYRMMNRDQPLVTAVDMLGYFAKHRALPQREVDTILYQNFHSHRSKRVFQEVIKQDPELWELVKNSWQF